MILSSSWSSSSSPFHYLSHSFILTVILIITNNVFISRCFLYVEIILWTKRKRKDCCFNIFVSYRLSLSASPFDYSQRNWPTKCEKRTYCTVKTFNKSLFLHVTRQKKCIGIIAFFSRIVASCKALFRHVQQAKINLKITFIDAQKNKQSIFMEGSKQLSCHFCWLTTRINSNKNGKSFWIYLAVRSGVMPGHTRTGHLGKSARLFFYLVGCTNQRQTSQSEKLQVF